MDIHDWMIRLLVIAWTCFPYFLSYCYMTRIDSMHLFLWWLLLLDSFPIWLIVVDLLYDSYWLILILVDSYSLTRLTHSDSLLVQVLVVADLWLYKNPLKPIHSSLPLSSSFTSKYNISCLVHCPLVWIPSILTLALVYLSVGDHFEVLQVVL